ncbi:hypothetical protein HPB50_001864 [Hyalomma asiaticum]|uniref:Uncharacterized protein n=1 Tax=Hyalomma asiaticum TaxID=266040 RepID=A0ACB7SY63_HYAAI|nr:hypothetical protein HPB50_001864 [Hyalomma asiaticum]
MRETAEGLGDDAAAIDDPVQRRREQGERLGIEVVRYLLGALPHDLALELCDILSAPLSQTPYDTLKKAILERTAVSERRRLQMLLSSSELRDRRPSQLVGQMAALLGVRASSFYDVLLKELFIQRLPPMAQMVLTTVSELSPSSLAALANKVYKIASSQLTVPDTSSETRTSTTLAHVPRSDVACQSVVNLEYFFVKRLTDLIASNLTTTADDASTRHFGHEQRFSRCRRNSPARFRRPSSETFFGVASALLRCTRPCVAGRETASGTTNGDE